MSAQHRFMYTHYSLTRRANWWQMVALNGLILPLQWTSYMESRTPLQSTKGNLWIHAFLGGGGGVGLACAPRRVAKCVLYACIGGEGVKKGQKTACTLLVCPLGNILAPDSDYRMPRVVSKCNRRENCFPNKGSLIFYLSGPSNFCLPAISLFDIFIKQDNSCKLLRQESIHNNWDIFESDIWSWLIIPKMHCWNSEHVKKWNAR